MDARHPLAVVTPTLDGDVLAVLARADAAFTPGELRHLIPDASVDGIRKVLNRLAAQGIVAVSRVGSAFTYSFNGDHLAAEAIRRLASPRAALAARCTASIEGWEQKPVAAALFGSWARGQAEASSDVDIFLVRPTGVPDAPWDDDVNDLEDAVTRWTGNDARAFVLREEELGASGNRPVLESILRDGLALYGEWRALRTMIVHGTRGDDGADQPC